MKYGPVLSYREVDQAEVGKKYVYSDTLRRIEINPDVCCIGLLTEKGDGRGYSFHIDSFWREFIREVIEEKPKYRPYKSCDEMIDDYKQRFNVRCGNNPPFIWIVDEEYDEKSLITHFESDGVRTLYNLLSFDTIFEAYKYIDGTPCGKLEDSNGHTD